MLQTPELTQAIGNLYRVFSHYELRADTEACSCCHTPEDEKRLHAKPLRKLSQRDLCEYSTDALYTWGTEEDFKHFLPRLFELLAVSPDFEVECADSAALFGKLTYQSSGCSSWRAWPANEQQAISGYLRAAWDAALNSNPEDLIFDEIHGWIQAIAQAEHDLSPYLAVWIAATSVNPHRHLARIILNEGLPNAAKPGPGYWEGRRDQWQQLVDWLLGPEVKQKLVDAVQRWSDLPFSAELQRAAVLLS